jgi:hypothetical protein
MNALLVQPLDGGRLRVTSTPMLARRGVLHADRELTHDGGRGLLLADSTGQVVCWIAEADWRLTPHQPARKPRALRFAPRGHVQAKRPEPVSAPPEPDIEPWEADWLRFMASQGVAA